MCWAWRWAAREAMPMLNMDLLRELDPEGAADFEQSPVVPRGRRLRDLRPGPIAVSGH